MQRAAPAKLLQALRFRVELWFAARTLPLRVRGRSFEAVLALASPAAPARYGGLSHEYIARSIARTLRHPLAMRDRRCLRAGLLGFRFLRLAGHQPELHFAVDRDSVGGERISAHCWVCIGGRPVVGRGEPNQVTIHVHRAGPGQ